MWGRLSPATESLVFRPFYEQDDRYVVAGVRPMRFALFRRGVVVATYSPSSSGDCHVEDADGARHFVSCVRYPVCYALRSAPDGRTMGQIAQSISRPGIRVIRLATGLIAEDRWHRPGTHQIRDQVGPIAEYGRRPEGVELRLFPRALSPGEWTAVINLCLTRVWVRHCG